MVLRVRDRDRAARVDVPIGEVLDVRRGSARRPCAATPARCRAGRCRGCTPSPGAGPRCCLDWASGSAPSWRSAPPANSTAACRCCPPRRRRRPNRRGPPRRRRHPFRRGPPRRPLRSRPGATRRRRGRCRPTRRRYRQRPSCPPYPSCLQRRFHRPRRCCPRRRSSRQRRCRPRHRSYQQRRCRLRRLRYPQRRLCLRHRRRFPRCRRCRCLRRRRLPATQRQQDAPAAQESFVPHEGAHSLPGHALGNTCNSRAIANHVAAGSTDHTRRRFRVGGHPTMLGLLARSRTLGRPLLRRGHPVISTPGPGTLGLLSNFAPTVPGPAPGVSSRSPSQPRP